MGEMSTLAEVAGYPAQTNVGTQLTEGERSLAEMRQARLPNIDIARVEYEADKKYAALLEESKLEKKRHALELDRIKAEASRQETEKDNQIARCQEDLTKASSI